MQNTNNLPTPPTRLGRYVRKIVTGEGELTDTPVMWLDYYLEYIANSGITFGNMSARTETWESVDGTQESVTYVTM